MACNRFRALTARTRRARLGMTLLELILALSLSVLIMAAIGMAINLHMKTLHARRTNVEEAQLAQQVLRRLANDLRSAVQYQVIDFSAIEQLASGQAGASAMAGMAGDDSGLGAALLAGLSGEDETSATEQTSIASSMAPPTIPGLYGNQYELQVDVSHLPRVDEYHVMLNPLSGETVADIPSDVKTVAYYLQPDTMATATTNTLNDPTMADRVRATGAVGRGLVRRQVDRAVSLWAAQNNNLDALNLQGELLAPEVTGLEFRYYDGTEWLTEWDSDIRQGLPVAVAIAIEIGGDPSQAESETPPSLLQPTTLDPNQLATADPARMLYRLVVHLPASEATSADTARFAETTATDTGSGSSTQSGNQSSGDNNDDGDAGGDQGGGGQGGQGGGRGGGRGGDGQGGRGGGRGGDQGNAGGDGGGRGGPGGGGGRGGQGGGGGRGGGQGGSFGGGGPGGGGGFGGGGQGPGGGGGRRGGGR